MDDTLAKVKGCAAKLGCEWTLHSNGRAVFTGVAFTLEVDVELLADDRAPREDVPGDTVITYKPISAKMMFEFSELEDLEEEAQAVAVAASQLSGLRTLLRDIRARASRYP